jgi:hypothetical protein
MGSASGFLNRRVRLGVIQESDVDNFDALVLNAAGGTVYPADALVWPFGIWQAQPSLGVNSQAFTGFVASGAPYKI